MVRADEGYYLTSPVIDNRPQGEEFYEAAQTVLRLVNGAGRVQDSSFQPVKLTGKYTDGDKTHHVISPIGIEARAHFGVPTITVSGQTAVPPPPPGPALVALATQHPDVSGALILLSKPEPLNWVELYKVFEVIRDSMKPASPEKLGLATKDEIRAFTGSANRPDVSGPDARHARVSGGPPQQQMTIAEARSFISRLTKAWTDALE